MRKHITIILLSVLLLFCFQFSVLADTTCSISEDLQTLVIDDIPYTRINTSSLTMDYTEYLEKEFTLTPKQEKTIEKIDLTAYESRTIIQVDIHYFDGSVLSIDFLQDEYLDTYQYIIEHKAPKYTIDFQYPSGNTVAVSESDLFGENVFLGKSDLDWCDYFYVSIQSSDGRLTSVTGALIIVDDVFYYVDFDEIHLESWYDFYPYDMSKLPAHEITNAEVILELMDAKEKYYEDDFGFLYNDKLSITISKAFATFIFILIPLSVFITFLILGIRSKTNYKKLFLLICSLSGVELLAAIIFLFIL